MIIQALSSNPRHHGCYYHFMQAIWRKVQALGLTDNYYCNPQDPTLKHFVQKMAAILFCPPAFVHTVWLGVQQEAPQIARVDELVDYFTSTWVSGQFQVRQRNYYKVDGPHTNNHLEGWHSWLKKAVGKPHPNVYELVEVIKTPPSHEEKQLVNQGVLHGLVHTFATVSPSNVQNILHQTC